MSMHAKDSSQWKTCRPFMKDFGQWKEAANGFVNVAGQWEPFLIYQPPVVTFIGQARYSSESFHFPSGAQPGDIAVFTAIHSGGMSEFTGMDSWSYHYHGTFPGRLTFSTLEFHFVTLIKVLDQDDFTTTKKFLGGSSRHARLAVWRGGSSVKMKADEIQDSGSSTVFPGIDKSLRCAKLIAMAGYVNGNTAASPGWLLEFNLGHDNSRMNALTIDPDSYADGTPITFDGFNSSYGQAMAIFEVV